MQLENMLDGIRSAMAFDRFRSLIRDTCYLYVTDAELEDGRLTDGLVYGVFEDGEDENGHCTPIDDVLETINLLRRYRQVPETLSVFSHWMCDDSEDRVCARLHLPDGDEPWPELV